MSSPVRFEAREDGVLAVFGGLTFASVAAAWHEGEARVRALRPRWLDLAGVERADSAGLACVLALLASARRDGGDGMRVVHAPESLLALAKVSDAEHWLI